MVNEVNLYIHLYFPDVLKLNFMIYWLYYKIDLNLNIGVIKKLVMYMGVHQLKYRKK